MTPTSRKSGIVLMDMVAAMGLMVILVVVFHSALHQIRKLEALALTQNRAQVVLENVLERLEAEEHITADTAGTVLDAEFQASALNIPHRFHAECAPHQGRLRLLIVRADQRPVALVEVGP